MQKFLALTLVCALTLGCVSPALAETDSPIPMSLKFNGESLETYATLEDDTVYLPVRAVYESLGARIIWNQDEQTAYIYREGGVFAASPEQDGVYISDGKMMAPLDLIRDNLLSPSWMDESVTYDSTARITAIESEPIEVISGLTGQPWSDLEEAYADVIDTEFAYDIAVALGEFVNSPLGGRNSGSEAEHEAAEYLEGVMKEIGLQNVTKDAANAAKWQFNGATLTIEDDDREILPYSYASGGTDEEGITAEIIYVGKGTAADYEDIDATGKIVLVDLDQRDEWWVTYPTIEAANRGAAAIINSNTSGYGQYDDETYNSQDLCGPVTIPSLNITVSDAEYIKAKLEEGPVNVTLVVDNIVEPGGTTYNVWGEIPGSGDSGEAILVGAHYDVHFTGFQDDSIAIGLVLAMAKAMIDSGYQPERNMRFILHGAEEYGAIDTRYDWMIGAWQQINNVRPEWAGQTVAFINFELPAYKFSDIMYVASTNQYFSFVNSFLQRVKAPDSELFDLFPSAIPETSWADNFSYSEAGVPSIHNGFVNDENGDVFDFYVDIYHSDKDTAETYDEAVLRYNLEFYGAMAMTIDHRPYVELDFAAATELLLASLDPDIIGDAYDELYAEASKYLADAANRYNELVAKNQKYASLDPEENADEIAAILADAAQENIKTLTAYEDWQYQLLKLTWEDAPIFPHEEAQENIMILQEIGEKLDEGDLDYILDELLWQLDSYRAWYMYFFSEETTDYFMDYVFRSYGNYWGTGKITGSVDKLYRYVNTLLTLEDESEYRPMIDATNAIIAAQQARLTRLVTAEIQYFKKLVS